MFSKVFESPIGTIRVVCSDSYVLQVEFVADNNNSSCNGSKWASNDLCLKAVEELKEYFCGTRVQFDLPFTFTGTDFQNRVWRALCSIPYGETRTYKQIAELIGNPKACRAVGMANNRNPLPIIVPCHRVVGADGSPVGYAGGVDVKQRLLSLEHL